MPRPVGPEWSSLSWSVEPDHALAGGVADRVVVRLLRPRVGSSSIALVFEARPVATCVGVYFEADDAFGSSASVALRAPIGHLIEDASVSAEAYFAKQGSANAEATLNEKLEIARDAERLAKQGVIHVDEAALAILDLFMTASIAASTRARPVAWMASAMGFDRKTIQRFIARGRAIEGERPTYQEVVRNIARKDGPLTMGEVQLLIAEDDLDKQFPRSGILPDEELLEVEDDDGTT